MAAASEQDYPVAARLLGGYYHQDWDLDDVDPNTAVRRFLTASVPGTATTLIAGLDRLRTDLRPVGDEAALDFLVTGLSCSYDPRGSGRSVHASLAHLQHLAVRAADRL